MFWVARRATLLIPSGPAHDPERKHLFVLMTDPVSVTHGESEKVLLVGVATLNRKLPHDATCVLYPEDHPFIKRESYVNYRFARIEEAAMLTKGVGSGLLIPKETVAVEIFARVAKGLVESRHTTPRVLRFYQNATGG